MTDGVDVVSQGADVISEDPEDVVGSHTQTLIVSDHDEDEVSQPSRKQKLSATESANYDFASAHFDSLPSILKHIPRKMKDPESIATVIAREKEWNSTWKDTTLEVSLSIASENLSNAANSIQNPELLSHLKGSVLFMKNLQ